MSLTIEVPLGIGIVRGRHAGLITLRCTRFEGLMPEDSTKHKAHQFSMYNHFKLQDEDGLGISLCPKTKQSIIIIRYIHTAEN
jgi:hypothetical protein